MKIKQSYKQALKKLVNGPKKDIEITNGDCIATQTQIHVLRWLEDCQALGYCVKVKDQWMLTNSGREIMAREAPKKIVSWASSELYDGKDLRNLTDRPGAYDYKKCPSIINGVAHEYYC